jgi:hypothetical protein
MWCGMMMNPPHDFENMPPRDAMHQPETAKEKNHHARLHVASINDRSLSLFLLQSPSHKPLGYYFMLFAHDDARNGESSAPAITLIVQTGRRDGGKFSLLV